MSRQQVTREVFPSKVGSPDVVGSTHRRGSAGHFLTAMETAVGFPGPARFPGVRRRQGFRGVQTEGSGGAARGERRRRGWGRAALNPPGAGGPPGEASQPAATRWGGGEGGRERSWANALGLWAERLTPQRRAGGRFPFSQPRTPGLPKAGGFARLRAGPFKSKRPGHVYQPRAKKAGHLLRPPPPRPHGGLAETKPRGGAARKGKLRAPAGRARSCGSPGRKASRGGLSSPAGSVDTGALWGRSLQHPPAAGSAVV